MKKIEENRMKLIDRGKIPYYCHVEGNGDGEYEYTDIAYRTEIESLPVVDAIPAQWLYNLAEKKEEEKDTKLSLMIKGVVALWHMENGRTE